MKYYSQNGQEIYLDNLFSQQSNRVFLNIGAYDGIKYRNSYFLEKYKDWRGLCVEVNNDVFNKLVKNRKCLSLNLAVSENNENKEFNKLINNPMLSGLSKECEEKHLNKIENDNYIRESVKFISFMQLVNNISNNRHNDYCSIDVEEFNILKSIDFTQAHISVFSIENTDRNSQINSLMIANGYEYIKRIGEDDIFILKEKL